MNEKKSINTIVHDVRNPLNTIVMNAELGKILAAQQSLPEEIVNIFETILSEAEKAAIELSQLTS